MGPSPFTLIRCLAELRPTLVVLEATGGLQARLAADAGEGERVAVGSLSLASREAAVTTSGTSSVAAA